MQIQMNSHHSSFLLVWIGLSFLLAVVGAAIQSQISSSMATNIRQMDYHGLLQANFGIQALVQAWAGVIPISLAGLFVV